MISHLTGGNCTQDEADAHRQTFAGIDGWDGTLPEQELDATTWSAVPFPDVVLASRLLVHCGANPIIAAASIQRAWFAQEMASYQITTPGASDEFVADVQAVIATARKEDRLVPNVIRASPDRSCQSSRGDATTAPAHPAVAAQSLLRG